MINQNLSIIDPEISSIVTDENNRQEDCIELIASENFTSRAVMETQGSVLTNKYAEGFPGKRYYCGCEEVDKAENIARTRLKNYLTAHMLMCSPILDHKQIKQYI